MNIKKILVCLLTVLFCCLFLPILVFAEENPETAELSPEEVRNYFDSVGTADSYEVFLRKEDYKQQLETAVPEESERKNLKKSSVMPNLSYWKAVPEMFPPNWRKSLMTRISISISAKPEIIW